MDSATGGEAGESNYKGEDARGPGTREDPEPSVAKRRDGEGHIAAVGVRVQAVWARCDLCVRNVVCIRRRLPRTHQSVAPPASRARSTPQTETCASEASIHASRRSTFTHTDEYVIEM